MNCQQNQTVSHHPNPNQDRQSDQFLKHKLECLRYLSRDVEDPKLLSRTDQYRLALADQMFDLQTGGRHLFHLSLTYLPYQDKEYSPAIVDRFFVNFYVKHLLPQLLGTKNIHTVSRKAIQPISYAFLDEHEMSAIRTVNHSAGANPLRPCARFATRLHHHAVLAVHPDTLDTFCTLIGENTLAGGDFSSKVMTSDIRECEPMCLLYASKMLWKYPDFLSFPDKFNRERRSNRACTSFRSSRLLKY